MSSDMRGWAAIMTIAKCNQVRLIIRKYRVEQLARLYYKIWGPIMDMLP